MQAVSRWRVLFYVYLSMLVFALTFQVIPPLLGLIITDLNISHTQAGALMSIYALPGIIISIPGGILTDLHGPKKVGLAALAVAAAGALLVGSGVNFTLLALGRFVAGIGALTLTIAAPQTISRWFSGKDLGVAMGIFNTAMPVGSIIALNTFGLIALSFTWRVPVYFTAFYSLIILFVFYFKHPGLPAGEASSAGPAPNFKEALSAVFKTGWPVWLVSMVWMLFNAATISYVTFAGDHFISLGYSVARAGFLASLFMFGSFLFSPLVGLITDRLGGEELFIVTGCTVLAGLFLLVYNPAINHLLLCAVIGFFGAFVPAPVFALIPKYLSSHQLGLGYGILSALLNLGMLVGPLVTGFLYDQTENYFYGFILMAAFLLLTALLGLVLLLKGRLKKRRL